MKVFTFNAVPDDAQLFKFAEATRNIAAGELVASHAAKTAADDRILRMARDLAFTTKRDIVECINHVVAQNPQLLRLSRAQVAAPGEPAHVTLVP